MRTLAAAAVALAALTVAACGSQDSDQTPTKVAAASAPQLLGCEDVWRVGAELTPQQAAAPCRNMTGEVVHPTSGPCAGALADNGTSATVYFGPLGDYALFVGSAMSTPVIDSAREDSGGWGHAIADMPGWCGVEPPA